MENNQISYNEWRHHTGASTQFIRAELKHLVEWEDAKQHQVEVPEVKKPSFVSQFRSLFTIFSILN